MRKHLTLTHARLDAWLSPPAIAALFATMGAISAPQYSFSLEQNLVAGDGARDEAQAGQSAVSDSGSPSDGVSTTIDVTIAVVNARTGEPVAGARVFVLPVAGSTSFSQRTDTTNDAGTCKTLGLPRGKVSIVVSANGMKSFKKRFVIESSNSDKQDILIKLKPEEVHEDIADPQSADSG